MAFKDYAERYGVQRGFVRDYDNNELYICNAVYTDDMLGDNLIPLEDVLK